MSARFIRPLLVGVVVLLSISTLSAAAYRTGRFPNPIPASARQDTAMPATPCGPNGMAGPYPCKKVDLLYFMPLASLDCGSAAVVWGWTDPLNQKEYALLACNTGVSFVDITNPTSPVYLGRLPGHSANSLWRDVKVYQHYAFVGSEASGHGLQIFDLHRLRSVPSPPQIFTEDRYYNTFTRSHTIAINENTGFLYAAGSQEGAQSCGGDLHMVNIQNPLAPTFAGCLGLNGYVHEAQCVTYTGPDTEHLGKEICFNNNGRFDDTDTLGIDDVTNKSAPVQLARVSYPNRGYTHQSWITEDQKYLLLDDEFDEQDFNTHTRTLIWDITDLNSPILMGFFMGPTNAVDHNQYIRGQYAFQSNYRAGLRIIDLHNISTANLSEYGYFDIYPADDIADYNANWCNYPYFPSGVVVASGIEQGLFILKPQFLPKVSVNDISIAEGNSGNQNITFTVTLSAPSSQNVIVNCKTTDGTATANQDYFPATPDTCVVVIPIGETTRTKQIGIVGDTSDEADETFFLNLTGSSGADIEKAQGVATIIDDDAAIPTITANDTAVTEGDSGTTTALVTLTLSSTPTVPVTVHWETDNQGGTAELDDYQSGSDTVTFTPPERTKTIVIPINGDMAIEANETFFVNLSNAVGASIGRSSIAVTITNDDILSVIGVSPTSGPSSGGTSVNFTGTRFSDGIEVHFGETEATDVQVVDDGHLTATTPAMPPATLVPIHMHFPTARPEPMHPAAITYFSDFLDVPAAHPFHNFIERIFRQSITSGCGGGNYCPSAPITRAQMAVFLLVTKFGPTYQPPPATGTVFNDVPANGFAAAWIEDLANSGITGGCSASPPLYCPDSPVTRGQMSVLLLATKEGSSYTPPPATGIFNDVPTDHIFARWVEELFDRGITAGCGNGNYCPDTPATRDQMAAFLVGTFGLP